MNSTLDIVLSALTVNERLSSSRPLEYQRLTREQQAALVEDIIDITQVEYLSIETATATLLARLTPASLESYANTLLAGQKRRAERVR